MAAFVLLFVVLIACTVRLAQETLRDNASKDTKVTQKTPTVSRANPCLIWLRDYTTLAGLCTRASIRVEELTRCGSTACSPFVQHDYLDMILLGSRLAKSSHKIGRFKMLDDSSAICHALALPELLECIILELAPRDIITTAMQVSHTWHELIITSQVIRKKLSLRSRATAEITNPLGSRVQMVEASP